MVTATAARAADYVVIAKAVEVDRPVDDVWSRVGDYRAISAWMETDCGYLSGAGGVGTVRRLQRGAVVEVMIAQTQRSYTVLQTRGNMAFAGLHGTLAAEPIGASRTRLVYTLFYDQSVFVADADRRAQRERLDGRYQDLLETMKAMAEGDREAFSPAPAPPRRKARAGGGTA
jgi:hypothetical protein